MLSPLLRDVDRPEDAESVAMHIPGLDFLRRHAELTRGRRCQPSERIFDAAHSGVTTVRDLTRTGIDCENPLPLEISCWSGAADLVDTLVA
jgi:hypothetical protein